MIWGGKAKAAWSGLMQRIGPGDGDLTPGQWRAQMDEFGLPLVAWRQSRLAKVHLCGVTRDAAGTLLFEFLNENDHVPEFYRQQGSGGWRAAKSFYDMTLGNGVGRRYAAAPWQMLRGFEVTDEVREFGFHDQGDQGRSLPPRLVLLARFDVLTQPIELSTGFFRADALSQLWGLLTREFIERRDEHLLRLQREAQPSQETVSPGARPKEL